MLSYGYRSRCCRAPIRLGHKKTPYNKLTVKVWVCTKCRRSNIDIISNEELNFQVKDRPFSSYSISRESEASEDVK